MKSLLLSRDGTLEIITGAVSLLILLVLMANEEAIWFLLVGFLLITSIKVAGINAQRSIVVFCFSLIAMGKVDLLWMPFVSVIALPYAEHLSSLGKLKTAVLAASIFLIWESCLLVSFSKSGVELAVLVLKDVSIFAFAVVLGSVRSLWSQKTLLLNEMHQNQIQTLYTEFSSYLHQHVASSLVKIVLIARFTKSLQPDTVSKSEHSPSLTSSDAASALRKIETQAESSLALVRKYVSGYHSLQSGNSGDLENTLEIIGLSGWRVIQELEDNWQELLVQYQSTDIASELLVNALKYGDRNYPLTIMIQKVAVNLRIACRNARSNSSSDQLGGTGFGLELIRNMVAKLNGSVHVEKSSGMWSVECLIPASN